MAKAVGLPKASTTIIRKSSLLRELQAIDSDPAARQRVLSMETEFRRRIDLHVSSLPAESAKFSKFNTSPFVLMIYCKQKGYNFVSQIEKDILPAKIFSSMETSAGRMTETVCLPVFGWETVLSGMHSNESVLDGRKIEKDLLRLATLKSGPRCLNDEMSKDIAKDIVQNCVGWAKYAGVTKVDFSYGVLYGTKRQSNKKDWYILRNIVENIPNSDVISSPSNKWDCSYRKDGVEVAVTVRIGQDWWSYLGYNTQTYIELCIALIRSCVLSTNFIEQPYEFVISDLGSIVSTATIPSNFNISLLQKSQFQWLFFLAKHFCDDIISD